MIPKSDSEPWTLTLRTLSEQNSPLLVMRSKLNHMSLALVQRRYFDTMPNITLTQIISYLKKEIEKLK